jgi:hypothetical protein
MATKTFTFEGDGYKFEVVLTLVGDEVTAKVIVHEGSADFNAFYWGDDVDDGKSVGLKGPLNMNGEGSQYAGEAVDWDGAFAFSNPGLGKLGETKATFGRESGDPENPTIVDLGVIGGMTKAAFDSLEFFGIRATSVNGGDSLKLVGKVDDEEEPPETDFFPPWGQNISNIILVFDQTEGDTKPKDKEGPDGDGYYTVKIDDWDGGRDLDDYIEEILAWLIANDPHITEDSVLLGVIIKGGIQDTNFYAYGANDTNGTAPDDAPDGLALSWEGSSNPAPSNAVDQSYEFEDVFAMA